MTDPFELRAIVDRLCRENFFAFAVRAFAELEGTRLDPSYHIPIICRLMMRVFEGEVRRALVCIPPRYLKTFLISIAYPAWRLGRDPKTKIICASYGTELAEKFSAETLKLMQTDFYRRVFPGTHLDPKKQNKTEIGTSPGGYRFATSSGATLTGRGADLIIIDDPLKAGDGHSPTARQNCIDWFQSTVHTRFNNPKLGELIVVAQRLHADDLPGHIIEGGGYEELILPAINSKDQQFEIVKGGKRAAMPAGRILHESRQGKEELDQLKKEMGEFDFEAQYNQQPLPPGGAIIKNEWINRYDEPPKKSAIKAVVQSWDTAYESDEDNAYTVCTTWAICPNGFYLIDVWRDRPKFPELVKAVYKLKAKHKAKMVIVEKKASGISLIQTIRDTDKKKWLLYLSPTKGKVERTEQQAVKLEQGKLWLPKEAPWLPAYESELLSFPQSKFDDQVDSTTQLLTATSMPQFHNMLAHL